MDISYTPKDAVIDTAAIILILLPEPTTTALGIALMARPRGNKKQSSAARKSLRSYPGYVYRVDNIRGREITWEAQVILPGQLPLQKPNRAPVKFRKREPLILSRTAATAQPGQPASQKLPPGVTVHHTLVKPLQAAKSGPGKYVGEITHHTLRQPPPEAPAGRNQPVQARVHHTIGNSPGYIIAQNAVKKSKPGRTVIHHTIKDAPAAQINSPAKIEKPVIINHHHSINTNPPLKDRAPLIPPPPPRRREPVIRKVDS